MFPHFTGNKSQSPLSGIWGPPIGPSLSLLQPHRPPPSLQHPAPPHPPQRAELVQAFAQLSPYQWDPSASLVISLLTLLFLLPLVLLKCSLLFFFVCCLSVPLEGVRSTRVGTFVWVTEVSQVPRTVSGTSEALGKYLLTKRINGEFPGHILRLFSILTFICLVWIYKMWYI